MQVPERNNGRRSGRCKYLSAFGRLAWMLALACLCGSSLSVTSYLSQARAQSVTINARAGEALTLAVGEGRILRFDQPVESVFVGNPAIADIRVVSPGVLYVYAFKTGTTNIMVIYNAQELSDKVATTLI